MSEGVIATDESGEINLINEAAGHLFNRHPNHLINKSIVDLLQIDELVKDAGYVTNLQEHSSIVLDFSEDEKLILLARIDFSTIYDQGKQSESELMAVLTVVTEDEKAEQEHRDV